MKRLFLILLIFFLPIFLFGCSGGKVGTPLTGFDDESEIVIEEKVDPEVASAQIDLAYRQSLAEILKPFWSSQSTAGIKEKILELTVPKDLLRLHFDLVVLFEIIEQGQLESDQSKIEDGLDKLNDLKEEFPWIAS